MIKIGANAGGRFKPDGSLVVAFHCTCGDRVGYYVVRKWLDQEPQFMTN